MPPDEPPFRIGSFVLTEDEVVKRKTFLEFTENDEQLLQEAHLLLAGRHEEIIERFYEFLLSEPHTREILSTPGLVGRLKQIQSHYFRELTSGRYDLDYFENRLKVGLAHERIGLSPQWYLGAYQKYLAIVTDVLSLALGRDYERFFKTAQALTKLIFMDMSLAIDAYVFSAQDSLARKAEALESANRELRNLEATKRRLTDMIVHDLQNPLSGILAFLQVLEGRSQGLTPEERLSLREAQARCNDLSQLILNVLQLSRAEEGKLEVSIENIDLVEIGRSVVVAFDTVAGVGQRHLAFSSSQEQVRYRTDQSLLRRILSNLIRNALRHTPAGTRVELSVDPGPPVSITVRDNGPGIPIEVQDRIFEPGALRDAGFQVDSGLGLVFCKMASEAIGMKLLLESAPGEGTRFTVAHHVGIENPQSA